MANMWLKMKDFVVVSSELPNGTAEVLPRLLTQAQFSSLLFFGGAMVTSMSAFGVCTNIVNLHIFLKMKPLDGVTVSFLCLSISDMLATFFNILYGICVITLSTEIVTNVSFTVSFNVLKSLFANTAQIFYTVTILNTLFIAISRLACVIRPLHFRHIFTSKLSTIYFISCFLCTVSLYLPLMSAMNFSWVNASGKNRTGKVNNRVYAGPLASKMKYVPLLMHTVIPIFTQIVIFLCVVGMAVVLRKSLKFRQDLERKKKIEETGSGEKNKSGSDLSGKELQAVRQVLLLSLIYLLCNMTKISSFVTESAVPDYKVEPVKRLSRLNNIVHTLRRFFECANSSMNIFVYLKYNQKFGQGYRKVCGRAKSDSE